MSYKLIVEGAICAVNFSSNQSRAKEALEGLPGKGHVLVQGSTFEKDSVQTIVKVCSARRFISHAESVQTTIEKLGGLDILVCNSGSYPSDHEQSLTSFRLDDPESVG